MSNDELIIMLFSSPLPSSLVHYITLELTFHFISVSTMCPSPTPLHPNTEAFTGFVLNDF